MALITRTHNPPEIVPTICLNLSPQLQSIKIVDKEA